MPLSMTGFGAARREDGSRSYVVELRSVNHRYCDVRTHLPSELAPLAQELESRVRKAIHRGRIDVSVAIHNSEEAVVEPVLDLARARGYKKAYERLAKELSLECTIPLSQIASAHGVIRMDASGGRGDGKGAVLEALDEALSHLIEMRRTEGRALREVLEGHVDQVEAMVRELEKLVPVVNGERSLRLRDRLDALLQDPKLDPTRLAQEAAILADRSDVTEELERLVSHIGQFRGMLASGDKVGRKLDFLLQEMNREVNTTGSKSSDARLAYLVVDLKAELERLREQIQNLE